MDVKALPDNFVGLTNIITEIIENNRAYLLIMRS